MNFGIANILQKDVVCQIMKTIYLITDRLSIMTKDFCQHSVVSVNLSRPWNDGRSPYTAGNEAGWTICIMGQL